MDEVERSTQRGGQESGLWLVPIPEQARRHAVTALEAGDWLGFLSTASNMDGVMLVLFNQQTLQRLGVFEAALLHAYCSPSGNLAHMPLGMLRTLFRRADPARLRACGAPLPGPGPFTLYRGVAGHGRQRQVHGISWTASPEVAAWFARRWCEPGLPDPFADPAVYRVTVPAHAVLACLADREEQEFLVRVPRGASVTRLPYTQDELEHMRRTVHARERAKREHTSLVAARTRLHGQILSRIELLAVGG